MTGTHRTFCWRCRSHERRRPQWLLLTHRPSLFGNASSLLHFAPERALRRRLAAAPDLNVNVTADMSQPQVDLRFDIAAMDLPDPSFDAVLPVNNGGHY